MTSPYRNETDALRERKESLEREAAQLKAETSHLDGLRSREQEIERELRAIAEKLGAGNTRRSLPMLDQVRVASPCTASWDEMLGDERVRFCLSCAKNVYNLSAMPREDAERLLQERAGGELCVRFYQRADGTILTEDCPVGVKKKRRKKIALAVAGAGAMAFAATSMLTRETCAPTQGAIAPVVEVTMGEASVEAPPHATPPPHALPPPPTTATAGDGLEDAGSAARKHVMGGLHAVPRLPQPPPRVAPPSVENDE
ncbi:MAG: hypothetical protein KF894_22040 [Labilithrix sp.]|nr:hypothetical protein [Labilithrix sp.]